MVVEANSTEEEVGIELVQEITPTRTLLRSGGRISVSVRNVTSHPIGLKPQLVSGKVSAATPVVGDEPVQKGDGRGTTVHCPNMPSRWEERIKAQIPRWENIFSKNDLM